MAQILQCQGCTARFRMRLRPGAPAHASVDCPQCGTPIELAPYYRTGEQEQPRQDIGATKPAPAQKGWQKIDSAAVFGRPLPAPPAVEAKRENITPDGRFQDLPAPKLGLFGAPQPDLHRPPRHPEADRPDPVRPLASALLRELRLQRTSSEALESQPQPMLAEAGAFAGSAPSSTEWISDELIQDAVDAAAEELFIVDDAPLPDQRLPGPKPLEESSSGVEVFEPPPLPVPAEMPAPELALAENPAPEPEPTPEPAAPQEPPPAPTTATLKLPEKSYRLRVGTKIYADIELDGLMELVRRGIWLIADEISEDDGPWMPLKEHPIYERVRDLLSDGLTTLLLTHAQLVEEIPEQAPTSKAPLPEATRQALATARVEVAPPTPDLAARPVRSGSNPLLWTYSIITTGVAASALTYALIAGPITESEPAPDEILNPMAVAALEESFEENTELKLEKVSDAVDFATFRTTQALKKSTGPAMAQEAIDQGNFQLARQIAAANFDSRHPQAAWQAVFDRAVQEDPLLENELFTITKDSHGDTLRALGGGSSVSLRFTEQGENIFAFKADQYGWEGAWSVEVATYQLCKLLPCDFHIPTNYSARISREDFDELYSRLNTPRQRAYAEERFEELIWVNEEGPDGVEREYLYGVLKDWVPGLTNFPIEYTDLWSRWFDLSRDEDILDEPREAFLRRLRRLQNGRFARTFAEEYEQETMRDFARQLSNLSVIDYLTSNFDRYSTVERYYGTNTHFLDGQLVALDNGAAFQFRPLIMMEPRQRLVQRYSRTLINAVRLMRPEVVNPVLFPDADAREALRLQVFWEQRDKLLKQIDDLVNEYGEDAVYAFD